jgi:hypothetical protein
MATLDGKVLMYYAIQIISCQPERPQADAGTRPGGPGLSSGPGETQAVTVTQAWLPALRVRLPPVETQAVTPSGPATRQAAQSLSGFAMPARRVARAQATLPA